MEVLHIKEWLSKQTKQLVDPLTGIIDFNPKISREESLKTIGQLKEEIGFTNEDYLRNKSH